MDSKPRAAVHSVRAAILTEYGGICLKKACEYAKKACDLDPKTANWFYIYSLSLTAQRRFLHSYKSCPSCPAENEIDSIQQAVMLSEEKNPLFIFHKTVIFKDIAMNNFHTDPNKSVTNLIENKTIVQMIKCIISLEPKDPHLIVKCAKILITLPLMVRDFKLGKQYLNKAVQMAPNDLTVLNAVTEAVELYKKMPKKNNITVKSQKNRLDLLNKELKSIVKKHKNGEDPVPYLMELVLKYNGHDRCKILAQICSYTILFTNNLKYGIERFMTLIEHPEIAKDDLILQHVSIFGSKKFNLAELICNEIRLTTNTRGSSEDMLFYYQMLTKIIEICNLEIKNVDLSMKVNLIIDLSTKCNSVSKQNQNTASKHKPKKKCSSIDTTKCNSVPKQSQNTASKSKPTIKCSSADTTKSNNSLKKTSQNKTDTKSTPINKSSSVNAAKINSCSKTTSQNKTATKSTSVNKSSSVDTTKCNSVPKQNQNTASKSKLKRKCSSTDATKTNSASKKTSKNKTDTKSTLINKSSSVNAPKTNNA